MVGQDQVTAMALGGATGDGQAQAMTLGGLARRPIERLAQLAQVLGFNAGADVYLSKRSSLEVIEAACHGVLRRLGRHGGDQLATPAEQLWRLHPKDWQLQTPNGMVLDLTHAEVRLLRALCETPGKAVTREALLVHLDKQETPFTLRNLDNIASRLRRKVQAACGLELPLRPSYGKGYTFAAHCELAP